MLATTPQFEAMVEGRTQILAYGVTIDLPTDTLYPGGALFPSGSLFPGGSSGASTEDVSIAVTRLEIDASIDTDMPEGTRLEEGFSAVQGTFTLSGAVDPSDHAKTAAWLFGRYSPPARSDGSVSPLARSDVLFRQVTISLGLFPEGSGGTPELLTKLVGLVEDYGLDSDGNVQFTVIDLRQQFRGSVDLPAVVTVPPFNAGCTNEFVVDRLLRQTTSGSISSWPAVRPSCVLAVGFRSSLWPEVGTLGSVDPSQFTPQFVAGMFGSALTNFASETGVVISALPVPYLLSGSVGNDLTVEFWAYSGGDLDADVYFDLDSDPLLIQVSTHLFQVSVGSATLSVTGSGLVTTGLHYFAVHVNWPIGGTAITATLRIDGTSYARSGTAASSRSGPWTQVRTFGGTSGIEALQVTTETAPAWNDTFTPRAVLDPSLNPLDVVPAITGDPWQTIQQLAASELAVAGFEGDVFRYRNRDTLRSSSSVRDITSDQALNAIEESSTAAAIVNRAQVGWTPWTFATTATTLWSAPKAHKVPAHGTWSTTVTIDGLAAQVDTVLGVLADGSTDTAHSHYRVSNDKAGTSTHAPIDVRVAQSSGSTFTITATNHSGTDAWLVSSADYILDSPPIAPGTPLLRIAGLAVTAGDEQTQDYQWPLAADGGAASSRFGEIAYQLTGNQWIQDEDAADQLAQDIVTASYIPRPDLVNVSVDPDPRLERCDRIHLIDTARTGVDEYALIFGYGISWEAASEPGGAPNFSMSVDARTIAAPDGWIGGVAGRSEGAVTTWGF